ncbi:hypothetical protein [Streptomyces sioyaensis]|uniref:hypothetical protein n=1 Tax=Streptomyces sioyaensis TaxID=67364 RepID=UPI003795E024
MFEAEQKVKFNGMAMPATIISGPHPTHGADRWLIRKADETVSLVKAAELSPILSRREVVARAIYTGASYARWENAPTPVRDAHLRIAGRVLAALESADAAEGVGPLKSGDRIRILRSGLEFASVSRGDVLTVMSVSDEHFKTNAPARGYVGAQWSFLLSNEGKGWERA